MRPPDPRKAFYVFASGKKGSGKSHYLRSWHDAYPYDRMVVDVTGDISRDFRREGIEFLTLDPHALPVHFPRGSDDRGQRTRVTAVLVPDMKSATSVDDMDRAVGLMLRGDDERGLLWVDEVNWLTSGSKTPPNTRVVLAQGRHHNLTLLGGAPRPMDIDTLWIAQADLVATFKTPQVYDRQRIADTIGYPRDEFDQLNAELSPERHDYTAYDAVGDQMYVCPPLPPRRAGRINYAPVPQ